MTSHDDPYQRLEHTSGRADLLEATAVQLKEDGRYHELFEVRKMQLRQRLGLPLLYEDRGDDPDDRLGRQLEDGLVAACREVGTLLMQQGQIREAWMYLRAVGDRSAVAAQLAQRQATEAELDEVIHVAFFESVDVALGVALILSHYGTCQGITTLESSMQQMRKSDREAAAQVLVAHVYRELCDNLGADIEQRADKPPAETSLAGLLADRPGLLDDGSVHLDATHLAATVRMARPVSDADTLRRAWELAEYGRRLDAQYHYADEPPFSDTYTSHALWFAALRGERVDEAVAYFREQAESIDPREQGGLAIEVYVALLARLGRIQEAIRAAIERMPDDVGSTGFAPTLIELAGQAGDYAPVLEYCRRRQDLLGFATALALQR